MTPFPVDVQANQQAAAIFLAVGAAFMLVSAIWTALESRRRADLVPLLALIGGFIASLEEGWINLLIQLWYPVDSPLVMFTAAGTPQPLYVHLIYPGFVGLGAYVIFRGLQAGRPAAWLWKIFLGIIVLDFLFELPATMAGVYTYYGNHPFQLTEGAWPAWVGPINAAGPILGGWLMYVLEPRLTGPSRSLLALMPPLAYAGVYGAAGWPTYTLLKGDAPEIALWCAAVITLLLCMAVIRLIQVGLPLPSRR